MEGPNEYRAFKRQEDEAHRHWASEHPTGAALGDLLGKVIGVTAVAGLALGALIVGWAVLGVVLALFGVDLPVPDFLWSLTG